MALDAATTPANLGLAVIAAHVGKQFNARQVLKDLSLHIEAGEFVALLGRSGSGKSTFLRLLSALDAEVEGMLRVPRRRAIVFQDARLMPWLPVLRNITIGLPQTEEVRRRGLATLAEVGLDRQAYAWPR